MREKFLGVPSYKDRVMKVAFFTLLLHQFNGFSR
jgi:hypothetical protein